MNTNFDGGNRIDQDSHGPYVFTLLEATDLSDQRAPEPITNDRTSDFTDKITKSIRPLENVMNLDIDDFEPFEEDEESDNDSYSSYYSGSGPSTPSSSDEALQDKRIFVSSGNKLDIDKLEKACAWLSDQSARHNKNDRAQLETTKNVFYRKVFFPQEGEEVISYWNNKPVKTAQEFQDFKEKMVLKMTEPVLICEMIKFTKELEKEKCKVIFHFASPIEASKFFLNQYNHVRPISPVLASHPSYKTLFEVTLSGEEPRPAKTVQELMQGTKLYFSTLQATYDGSALSHRIPNEETQPARRAAVQAYVTNQKVDVFDASLTVMTDDPILPFKEGLMPLLQDNLFWSTIQATSGPTITTRGAPDILPDLSMRRDIPPGNRLNSLMINNKHNRAQTISQIVALNRLNTRNKDYYEFCPNHRNKCK